MKLATLHEFDRPHVLVADVSSDRDEGHLHTCSADSRPEGMQGLEASKLFSLFLLPLCMGAIELMQFGRKKCTTNNLRGNEATCHTWRSRSRILAPHDILVTFLLRGETARPR